MALKGVSVTKKILAIPAEKILRMAMNLADRVPLALAQGLLWTW